MSDSKALTVRSAEERLAWKKLRRERRQLELEETNLAVQLAAVKDMDLRRFAFSSDEELKAKGFSAQEIAKIRSWEQPKRHTAFALEAASTTFIGILRRDRERKAPRINVEKMIIKLPEVGKDPELPEPITVQAEVVSK